jgi:proline iminopeptidase
MKPGQGAGEPGGVSAQMRDPRLSWLRVWTTVFVAVALGLGGLVAAATVSSRPALFLGAGLAAFLLTAGLGFAAQLARLAAPLARRRSAVRAGVATGLSVLAFILTVLVPMRDPRLPPAPVDGQTFWDLPTGSRIAYVHRPAVGGAHDRAPVVFVHGGPSVADMWGDVAFFGQLAQDGFDVYVYDSLGTGRSSRLADPRGYTLERDVADLAAIREQIGAEHLILVGHSYGAVVAAAFLAQHPGAVERVVFSSPGGLYSLEAGGAHNLPSRLTLPERLSLYRLLLWPRATLTYELVQLNPPAAHAFAGDPELDARFDRVYARSEPALHCRGAPPGPELHGLGFYAYAIPRPPQPDLQSALDGLPTPALVIKGACDYLTWTSAQDYLQALPNATLVYLPAAGHNAYQDQPERFLANIRAFLAGAPPPDAVADTGRPDTYEGPA